MSTPETENDFDFYLRFVKPLVLNLSEPNDRVLAAAWVQKLRDEKAGDEQLRTSYLKLLLFVLQRKKLIGVFSENPKDHEKLEELPEANLHDVARDLLAAEEQYRIQKLGPSGDFPPYSTEHSADLLEYSAAQDIPNFGVHAYYAFSNEPLPNWERTEKAIFPRGATSAAERSRSRSEATSKLSLVISEPTLDAESFSSKDKTSSRSKSRGQSKSRSRSRSKSKSKKDISGVSEDDRFEDSGRGTLLTTELGGRVSPKRKSLGDALPSPPLGAKVEKDTTREAPTWGSNLIGVSEPPVREIVAESLPDEDQELLEAEADILGAGSVSSASSGYPSLPYKTPSPRKTQPCVPCGSPAPPTPPYSPSFPQGEEDPFFLGTPPSFFEAASLSDISPIKDSPERAALLRGFSPKASSLRSKSPTPKRTSPAQAGERDYSLEDLKDLGIDASLLETGSLFEVSPIRVTPEAAAVLKDFDASDQASRSFRDSLIERQSIDDDLDAFDKMIAEFENENYIATPSPYKSPQKSPERPPPVKRTPVPSPAASPVPAPKPSKKIVKKKKVIKKKIPTKATSVKAEPVEEDTQQQISTTTIRTVKKTVSKPVVVRPTRSQMLRLKAQTVAKEEPPAPCPETLKAPASRSRLRPPGSSQTAVPRRSQVQAPAVPQVYSADNQMPCPGASRIALAASQIPGASRIQAPGASRIQAPGASRIPAAGASRLPAPRTSQTIARRISGIPQPGASRIATPGRSGIPGAGRIGIPCPGTAGIPTTTRIPEGPTIEFSQYSPLLPEEEEEPFFLESPPSFLYDSTLSSIGSFEFKYPFPQRPCPAADLSAASLPYLTPSPRRPCPAAADMADLSAASLPYRTPPQRRIPSPYLDYDELQALGLEAADLQDDVFDLEEIDDINISTLTVDSNFEYEERPEFNTDDTDIDRELDDWDRRIAELEAEHAEDIALYGSPSPTRPCPAAADMADLSAASLPYRTPSPRRPCPAEIDLADLSAASLPYSTPQPRIPPPAASRIPPPRTSRIPPPRTSRIPAPGASRIPAQGASGITGPGTSLIPAPGASRIPALGASRIPAPGASRLPAPGTSRIPASGTKGVPLPRRTGISRPSTGKIPASSRISEAGKVGKLIPPGSLAAQDIIDAANKQRDELSQINRSLGWDFEEQEQLANGAGTPVKQSDRRSPKGISVKESISRAIEIATRATAQLAQVRTPPPSLDEYFEELEDICTPEKTVLEEEYASRYQRRRPDMPSTPPMFSKYASVMGEEVDIEYHPSEFGEIDESEWQSAEQFFESRKSLSPPPPEATRGSATKKLIPGVERELQAEEFFARESEPDFLDIDDDFENSTASQRSPAATREDVQQMMQDTKAELTLLRETTPAGGGLPVTTPRRSPSPRRTNRSLRVEAETEENSFELPSRDSSPPLARNLFGAGIWDGETPPRDLIELPRTPPGISPKTPLSPLTQTSPVESPSNLLVRLSEVDSPPDRSLEEMIIITGKTKSKEHLIKRRSSPPDLYSLREIPADYPEEHLPFLSQVEGLSKPFTKSPARIRVESPMEILHESPIKVPEYTEQDHLGVIQSAIQELQEQYYDLPELQVTLPEDLLGHEGPATWPTSPGILDQSILEDLPSPIKHPVEVPGWKTPPRLRGTPRPKTARRPLLPELTENVRIRPDERDILGQEIVPRDLLYSPPPLSPEDYPQTPAAAPCSASPSRLSPCALPSVFEAAPVDDLFGEDIYGGEAPPEEMAQLMLSPPRTPPRRPVTPPPLAPSRILPPRTSRISAPGASRISGSGASRIPDPGASRLPAPGTSRIPASGTKEVPLPRRTGVSWPTAGKTTIPDYETPDELYSRLLEGELPPYYCQEEMTISRGRTRGKRQVVKRRSSPPSLYSLRETPIDYPEEHLPFLWQVEGLSKPFSKPRKRIRVGPPPTEIIRESPIRVPKATAEEHLAEMRQMVREVQEHFSYIPETQVPLPEDLMGVEGTVDWAPCPGVLDQSIPQELPSPIRPPTDVPGWKTPPRLRGTARPKTARHPLLPELTENVRIRSDERDILGQETVPRELLYSPPPLSPGDYPQTPAAAPCSASPSRLSPCALPSIFEAAPVDDLFGEDIYGGETPPEEMAQLMLTPPRTPPRQPVTPTRPTTPIPPAASRIPPTRTSQILPARTLRIPAPGASRIPAPGASRIPAPGASRISAPGASRISAPRASRIPPPGASRIPAPGASRIPAPGASRIPAPGTSRIPAPGASRLPAPGTSRIPASGTKRVPLPRRTEISWPTAGKTTIPDYETPSELYSRLLEGEFPPYYCQEEMTIPRGKTRGKRQVVKRRSSPPSLYSLRETPIDYPEEHLPFLWQVEGLSKPFTKPRKRIRVAPPPTEIIRESPIRVPKATAEEHLAEMRQMVREIQERLSYIPETQVPLPEDLMGAEGTVDWAPYTGILDEALPENLRSPIRPPTVVPGWTSPPHLERREKQLPPFSFQTEAALEDLLHTEMPPPEMFLSSLRASPASSRSPPQTSTRVPVQSVPCVTPYRGRIAPESPHTPPRRAGAVFEDEPQFLVLEMPPDEFMPPFSPINLEKRTRFSDESKEQERLASRSPCRSPVPGTPSVCPALSPQWSQEAASELDTSLEDYEALERETFEAQPVPKTPVPPPSKALIDQMIETAGTANRQLAETGRSPTWQDRMEFRLKEVRDILLTRPKPAYSPTYGQLTPPRRSPELPTIHKYADQIEEEFIPEEVWGYRSPKTPPRSPEQTAAPATPTRSDIFDVEVADEDYLDQLLLPEVGRSPTAIPTPPRVEDYYTPHTPPSPGSPDQLAEELQAHEYTDHYYDRDRYMMRSLPSRSRRPRVPPIREAFREDSPVRPCYVPEGELLPIERPGEEFPAEEAPDVPPYLDMAVPQVGLPFGMADDGMSFESPPRTPRPKIPGKFAYFSSPQYKNEELTDQSPPAFYQSPIYESPVEEDDLFEESNMFEDTAGPGILEDTPPMDYAFSPPPLSPPSRGAPCSPPISPGFPQSIREHEYTESFFDPRRPKATDIVKSKNKTIQLQRWAPSPPLDYIAEADEEPEFLPCPAATSPARASSMSNYELPKPTYPGSPGREFVRTPMRREPPPSHVVEKTVTIVETDDEDLWNELYNIEISERIPFADQGSPEPLDTSLIPSDLDASFMEEDQAGFKWMG